MPDTGYDSDVEILGKGKANLRHGGKWTSDVAVNLPKDKWPAMNNEQKVDYLLQDVIKKGRYTDVDVRIIYTRTSKHS